MNQVEIYQTKDKQTHLEVKFEEDFRPQSQISANTPNIYLKRVSWTKIKLFGNSEQFGLKAKSRFPEN
jgi:hypothetical protein